MDVGHAARSRGSATDVCHQPAGRHQLLLGRSRGGLWNIHPGGGLRRTRREYVQRGAWSTPAVRQVVRWSKHVLSSRKDRIGRHDRPHGTTTGGGVPSGGCAGRRSLRRETCHSGPAHRALPQSRNYRASSQLLQLKSTGLAWHCDQPSSQTGCTRLERTNGAAEVAIFSSQLARQSPLRCSGLWAHIGILLPFNARTTPGGWAIVTYRAANFDRHRPVLRIFGRK